MPKKLSLTKVAAKPAPVVAPLLADVRGLILAAREQVARTVNTGLALLYWEVGGHIRKDVLKEKRAEYGEEIVQSLSAQLETEFGRGFSRRNLFRMIRFAEAFPDRKIVSALLTQLGWTHFLSIIPMDDPLKRDFYAEMCRIERWSTRTLEKKIGGMLYERTALSKKPDKLIRQELAALREQDKLTPDLVFRDPYVLDFLRLRDTYAERETSKRRFCARWRRSSSNSASASRFSNGRSASRWTARIITSTCCFTIVTCGGSWRLT